MILSIVNKAVSNFFHFSAENSYLFGIHKIIALAGLVGVATEEKDGLLSKDGFIGRSVSDLNSMGLGIARFSPSTLNIPSGLAYDYGIAVCFTFGNVRCQFAFSSMNGLYFRVLWDYWFGWKQIG